MTDVAVSLVAVALMVLFLGLLMGGNRLQSYFHLVDKREVVTETSWGHLTRLMEVGDVSLRQYRYSGEPHYSMSFSMKLQDNSTVSADTSGKDVSKIVNDMYAWALGKGYLGDIK